MTAAELLSKAIESIRLSHSEICEGAIVCETGDGVDGRGCICGVDEEKRVLAVRMLDAVVPFVVEECAVAGEQTSRYAGIQWAIDPTEAGRNIRALTTKLIGPRF